jgi:hypothetical protein
MGEERKSMWETKFFCLNCHVQVEPTDSTCHICGKNLSEVGKEVVETFAGRVVVVGRTEITKKQRSIVQKVFKSLKDEFAKREIESVTFGFPQLVTVTIKKKEKKEGKNS